MLNCKYLFWNVAVLLVLSSVWIHYFLILYIVIYFCFRKEDQVLLQGDGGKDKNPIILCTIKAMIQKTGCVDLEFHLVIVILWFEKGIASHLIEEMLFK